MLQPLLPIPDNATVHCLMDEECGTWKEEMLRAFFHDEIAVEILRLPISHHDGEDFPRWPFTKLGEYSVKSAYNLARSTRFTVAQSRNGRGQTSDTSTQEKQWKAIWAIEAPEK